MSEDSRYRSISAIASIAADYRTGEIPLLSPDHVEKWTSQFEALGIDRSTMNQFLAELAHVLSLTYLSKEAAVSSLREMLTDVPRDYGPNPSFFWGSVNFLQIQRSGSSQSDMIHALDEVMKLDLGFGVDQCGSSDGLFVYLDDCSFTGKKVLDDLSSWISVRAPTNALVIVLLMVDHQGVYYRRDMLRDRARAKNIEIHWLSGATIEDRVGAYWSARSGVLRPSSIDARVDPEVYAALLRTTPYDPKFRPFSPIVAWPFSSEVGRNILEQVFFRTGLHIWSLSEAPNVLMRPLGYSSVNPLGFGSLTITHRNCPNNSPLALWWGDSLAPRSHPFSRWRPLFPRRPPDSVVRSGLVPRLDDVPF